MGQPSVAPYRGNHQRTGEYEDACSQQAGWPWLARDPGVRLRGDYRPEAPAERPLPALEEAHETL
jgi:hypothetical protein